MLTDVAAKQAKAKVKDYKLADSGGMYLFVAKSGRKTWRLKYRYGGKEKRLLLGAYPEVRLSEARARRDEAKLSLRVGRDPSIDLKKKRLANEELAGATLEKYARDWWAIQCEKWKPTHSKDVITAFERDIFPDLGSIPIHELDGPLILASLEKIEKRGAIETARRSRQRIERVIAYAKAKGAPIVGNPAIDVIEAMKPLPRSRRWPAFVDLEKIRHLISVIDHSKSMPVTRLASRFLALVAQRPGMVHRMKWKHIEGVDWNASFDDLPNAMWHIPSEEMKLEFGKRGDEEWDHFVPLAPGAVEVLMTMRKLTGKGPYVFPNNWNPQAPMTENALNALYRRLGFKGKHVPHGWRSSFSTIMNERLERGSQTVQLRLLTLPLDRLEDRHSPPKKLKSLRQYSLGRSSYLPPLMGFVFCRHSRLGRTSR